MKNAILHSKLSLTCFRKRIGISSNKRDPLAEQIISTLNSQNENGRRNIANFEEKLGQLLNIVQDIQSKLSIQDQQKLNDDIKFIDKD